jgi:muramidase (phage lysozyme)
MTKNMKAFLDMIAWSEIGPAMLAKSDDGYNVLVGSTAGHPLLFSDYAKHPRIRNDDLDSDAAGRYQFLGRYWVPYRDQLHLPDFGHDSQDRWAMQLIHERHATDDVEAGRIEAAIAKCASRWASLSGAGYGQHENSVDSLVAAYGQSGGTLA